VVDYLRKPIGERQVIEAVERALQKRAAQRRREQLVQLIYQALEALHETPSAMTPTLVSSSRDSDDHLYLLPLVLDLQRRQLFLDPPVADGKVDLSESEARIMKVLMKQPGRVFSCLQLAQEALGEQLDAITAENIVRPLISRLRAKLRSFALPGLPVIRTVRGRGYFLEESP
jgi:DNA-binding response OmpR family regulator